MSWEEVNAELLAQVFRDKTQQSDCPGTLCAQDWSNGVQMLGNGTCTGKNLLIGRVFNKMVIFHSYVSLPEGIYPNTRLQPHLQIHAGPG